MLVFVGIGLAVFRDYFDERIYVEQDLEDNNSSCNWSHKYGTEKKKESTEVDPQSAIYRGEHVDV